MLVISSSLDMTAHISSAIKARYRRPAGSHGKPRSPLTRPATNTVVAVSPHHFKAGSLQRHPLWGRLSTQQNKLQRIYTEYSCKGAHYTLSAWASGRIGADKCTQLLISLQRVGLTWTPQGKRPKDADPTEAWGPMHEPRQRP